jgi:hypothetical protein
MLPLVLEPTAHYLITSLPIGGILIGLAGYLVWSVWRAGSGLRPVQGIACLLMAGLGLSLLVQPIGWRFTADRDGLALKAPYDPFAKRGDIRWPELQSTRFGSTTGRFSYPTVEFVGSGTVISIFPMDGVPDSYWPALAAVIEANAPGFKFSPDKEHWLADVHSLAHPEKTTMIDWTFTARDGEGRLYTRD